MSTFYVRKNGSGTHTTIQSAIIAASSGDTINIGEGLFQENIDLYKNGITLIGAGKALTEVRGIQETQISKTCTFSSGSTTISVPAGTSGFLVGRIISGTGIVANSRITSISANSFTISAATTAARTNSAVVMSIVECTMRVRSVGPVIKNMKITGIQALTTRSSTDNGAVFFRNTGNGSSATNNYTLEDCEIVANGDSAIMCDPSGVGGGIVRNNVIKGQTFVGSQPSQVDGFSTLVVSGNILTSTTVQFPSNKMNNIVVGSTFLAVSGFISSSTSVASISGNTVTLNKALLSGVGTSQNFTLTNIQFIVPNVARQLCVFQPNNTSVQFLNNTINGKTGSGISYNTAVTIDPAGSVATGNLFEGEFKYGYALRVRGTGSTVSNNVNKAISPNENAGYLIGSQSGLNIDSNLTIDKPLAAVSQTEAGKPVSVDMGKGILKSISKVSSNAVFSNEANWGLVTYVFKHTLSSKRLVVSFDGDFNGAKSIALKSNMVSGDRFELKKIIISKPDRTLLVLKRDEIENASSMDFTLS